MLGSVEILPGELTDTCSESFLQPSLFDPPRIETACILAGHAARASQEPQIGSKIAPALPERGCMEIPSLVTGQLAKIDVHRPAESVPNREALWLLALEVPEGIAHILKIEVH